MNYIKSIVIILSCFALNGVYAQGIVKNKSIYGINNTLTNNEVQYQNKSTLFCDTVFSFNTRPMPSGLTWDGQNFWYVDTSYIYKVSPAGIYIDSINNPASNTVFFKAGGLTYDGLNLWYADEETAKLFKINPINGNVIQELNLPSFGSDDPNGFGLAWDGVNLWHSQYIPPGIYKLNPSNGSIIDSLTTTLGVLGLVWINEKLYGISEQQLFKISPDNGAIEDTMNWCVPFALGLTWDGFSFWNVSGQDSIYEFPTGGMQKIYKVNTDFILSVSERPNFNTEVEIFPNPTTGNISIKGKHLKTIEIYNMKGEIVYIITRIKHTLTEVNLSKLPKGIYFVNIYDGKKMYTRKIVLQ
jgi:hypothetical protein